MRQAWQAFLRDEGGEFEAGRLRDFGNANRELQVTTAGNVLCDLGQYGLILAHGADAGAFLQGQLSNDFAPVSGGRSHQLAALCTPKGRVRALVRGFRRGDNLFLRLPQALVEPTVAALKRFILRSKVSLAVADDALLRFGLAGPKAGEWLTAALGCAPAPGEVLEVGALSVLGYGGCRPRFEVYGDTLEPMQRLWRVLRAQAAPAGGEAWETLETLCGLPEVYLATVETFVPQQINLDAEAVDGVSFSKGCYPGQEVVARLHYLGRPSRRMALLRKPGGDRPAPGDALADADGAGVAEVVRAAPHPDSGWAVLAVVRTPPEADPTRAPEPEGLRHAGAGPELVLRPLPLPYPLPEPLKTDRTA